MALSGTAASEGTGVDEPVRALVGRLVGDAPLSDGSRLADRFHSGRFVLLDRLGGALAAAIEPWTGRVTIVVEDAATTDWPDAYRAATGLLIRPDGVIAWATDAAGSEAVVPGLTGSLTRWAGGRLESSPRRRCDGVRLACAPSWPASYP